MAGQNKKQNDVIVELRTAATALRQQFGGKTVIIDGKAWKVVDLATLLENQATELQNTAAMRAAWLQAVQKNRTTQDSQINPVMAGLKTYVANAVGSTTDEYRAFGFTVRKKPQRTAKDKAAAVDQLLATRAARHTMGKKQRQAVVGVVATPVTSAATTATTAPAGTPAPANAVASTSSSNGATTSSH